MRPRILVVDDEEAVRTAVSLNLRRGGMEVLLANSAEEALDQLASHPVDLVLTDVKMPGANGLELLTTIRKKRPELPVVVRGDKDVPYGRVVHVMTLLQKAGAPSVGLMTDPPEGPGR